MKEVPQRGATKSYKEKKSKFKCKMTIHLQSVFGPLKANIVDPDQIPHHSELGGAGGGRGGCGQDELFST